MKTRFSPLVDVRKRKVDKAEADIRKTNAEIERTREKIAATQESLLALAPPTQGDFQEILRIRAIHAAYLMEINDLKNYLTELEKLAQTLHRLLKEAMIEFEKARHLHDLEHQKILKERARNEARELDDISLMLHNNARSDPEE